MDRSDKFEHIFRSIHIMLIRAQTIHHNALLIKVLMTKINKQLNKYIVVSIIKSRSHKQIFFDEFICSCTWENLQFSHDSGCGKESWWNCAKLACVDQ